MWRTQISSSCSLSETEVQWPVGLLGVDDDEGAGAGGDGAFELGEVDGPAVVEEERVGAEAHVVEVGEEVEERVAGLGDEDLVAGGRRGDGREKL